MTSTLSVGQTANKAYLWNATSYLKGIAILAVLINHYIIDYTSWPLCGFANGIIAIFFILSGYGCFHSLERRTLQNKTKLETIAGFWLDRGVRVIPLYLLALAIYNYVFGWETILWFIPYILECYLIAPFAYYAIKKYRIPAFVAIAFAVFFLLNFTYYLVQPPQAISQIMIYRGMALTHILLFCLGMILPALMQTGHKIKTQWGAGALALLFLLSVFLTENPIESNVHRGMVLFGINVGLPVLALEVFLFVVSAMLLVLAVLSKEISLPLSNAVSQIGNCSYSLYILHQMYYLTLGHFGLLETDSVSGALIVIALFPLFFGLCKAIEDFSRRILSTRSLQRN